MRKYRRFIFLILGILIILIITSLVMPGGSYRSSQNTISSSFEYNDKGEPNNSNNTLLGWYILRPAIYVWNAVVNFFTSLVFLLQHGYRAPDTTKLNEDVFNKVVEPDKVIHYFGNTTQEDIDKAASWKQ